jgi:hypothetical protein
MKLPKINVTSKKEEWDIQLGFVCDLSDLNKRTIYMIVND